MNEENLDASNSEIRVNSNRDFTVIIQSHSTLRSDSMADTTYTTDPSFLILQGESDIRADVKSAEANIRQNVTKAEADVRQDVAKAEADIRHGVAKSEADIRYDIAKSESDIRQEIAAAESELKGLTVAVEGELKADIKESQYELVKENFKMADRVRDQATQYYIATNDKLAAQAASLAGLRAAQDVNFNKVASDAIHSAERVLLGQELQAEKLAYKMLLDGDKTRDLLNTLNGADLNRQLIEAKNQIADLRSSRHHCEDRLNQTQFQSLASQLQMFQSDLQSTKQGMINLGTMTGTSQTSNPTNIR